MKRLMAGMLILVGVGCFAGSGTDTLSFLNVKPSARAVAVGEGFVAVADDANAAFYNPAGLSFVSAPEFSLMHMAYFAETSYEYGVFALPLSDKFTMAAYVVYLNYGSIEKNTEDGSGLYVAGSGNYTPSDLAVAVSGGMKISDGFSAGLTVKYASESIDTMNITGIMADAGILAETDGVRAAMTLNNIGSTTVDKAPMGAKLGVSSKFKAMAEEDLTVAAGAEYNFAGSKVTAGAGGEWRYEDFLSVRGSYTLFSDSDTLNLGVGIKQDLGGITGELAYTFSLLSDLGSAHRISAGVKLSPDTYKKAKKSAQKITPKAETKSALKYYFKKK